MGKLSFKKLFLSLSQLELIKELSDRPYPSHDGVLPLEGILPEKDLKSGEFLMTFASIVGIGASELIEISSKQVSLMDSL